MLLTPARWCALAALAAAAAGVAGCKRGKDGPPPPGPAGVVVAKPVAYPVQSYFEYNGYLDAVETVEIKARVKGFLNEVKFKEGEEVVAGTPLYTIDPREYEASLAKSVADIAKAKADIANAKAQITLAAADRDRQKEAFDKSATAKTDLDKAVATLAANEAQLDVARANQAAAEAARDTAKLQLEYTDIRAPIAGRISRTLVTKGNLVGQTEATLLTTIVSVDPLYVYFDAPERDLVEYQRAARERNLPTATSRQIPLEVGVADEAGYPHRGTIDFQENRVDTGSGTVRLRGVVPNPPTGPPAPGQSPTRILYPGLYARVRVPSGPPETRPVIPEEALLSGQEGRYVYVLGPDNVVVKKVVTVGTRIYRQPAAGGGKPPWTLTNPNPPAAPPGGPPPGPAGPPPPPKTELPVTAVVAIDKGLDPGDVVIVDGLQKARPGQPVVPEVWRFAGPPPPKAGGPPLPAPPKAGGLPDTRDPKQ